MTSSRNIHYTFESLLVLGLTSARTKKDKIIAGNYIKKDDLPMNKTKKSILLCRDAFKGKSDRIVTVFSRYDIK